MLEQFLKYFLPTLGVTSGVAVVIVPILVIIWLTRQIGGHFILKRFRRLSDQWIDDKVEEEKGMEEPPDGTGTPPFV